MKTYSLFNSNITSEIELSNILSSSKKNIDLSIFQVTKSPITKNFKWFNKIYYKGKLWISYASNNHEYCVRYHSTADFKIDIERKEISFYKRKSTNLNTLKHLLNDSIIPLALSMYDKIFFHASSVKIGKYAVSFQAPSGSGKSTLAAYFSTKKHTLLTDDSLLLKENKTKIYAYPSYQGIRLWPDNIVNIFNNDIKTKSVSQFNNKQLIVDNIKFENNINKPVALKSIYFIYISDHTDIATISPTEAFSLIIKNIFRLNFKNRELNKNQFEFINKVLNSVELYKLNYKKEYESLEILYNLVTKQTLDKR